MHQGEPRIQLARRARRDLGHRAAELHFARARAGESLRRGVARDGWWRGGVVWFAMALPRALITLPWRGRGGEHRRCEPGWGEAWCKGVTPPRRSLRSP